MPQEWCPLLSPEYPKDAANFQVGQRLDSPISIRKCQGQTGEQNMESGFVASDGVDNSLQR